MKTFADKPQFLQETQAALSAIYDKLAALENLRLSSLSPSNTMAISVDMNNGFAKDGALYSHRVRDLIPPTAAFFAACLNKGIATLAFSDRHAPGCTEIESYPQHCMEDTPECELVDELAMLGHNLIYKNSTNAFFVGLGQMVDKGIQSFIITGCCTDICIYQLAITLRAYLNEKNIAGNIILPLALVDTYDAPWHNAQLLTAVFAESLASNGIQLVKQIILD